MSTFFNPVESGVVAVTGVLAVVKTASAVISGRPSEAVEAGVIAVAAAATIASNYRLGQRLKRTAPQPTP
jgi:hypothetical protein